jgi:hypothetical protein
VAALDRAKRLRGGLGRLTARWVANYPEGAKASPFRAALVHALELL